jgi:hypothetical protein
LINGGNNDIGSVLRVQNVDVAKVARVEGQFELS